MGAVTAMNEHAPPLTVSVQEAAQMLGISTWLYYERVKTGDVPFIKIGKRIRVPLVQLERFLEAS
jgi:excisionase family DNA binding protein